MTLFRWATCSSAITHALATNVLAGSLLVQIADARDGTNAPQVTDTPTATRRDAALDFDFEIGTWKTHLRRLVHPLTGSTIWAEYNGTTTVRRIWNGRANLVELEVGGPNGHIQALSLRLYNPDSHQWSLNFASAATGALGTPAIGEFKDGRGEFYDQEMLGSRSILVRFVITEITHSSCHFEQSFSDDGGKTWEVNWIAQDTLISNIAGNAD